MHGSEHANLGAERTFFDSLIFSGKLQCLATQLVILTNCVNICIISYNYDDILEDYCYLYPLHDCGKLCKTGFVPGWFFIHKNHLRPGSLN